MPVALISFFSLVMAMQEPGRPSGFSCKQCGMVYLNMPLLMEHMDTHQQEEERKFKCDECGRGYRHAGSLANHKKTHDVGSFQCNICGKENSNALALKNHLRSHTSQKKYLCLECGKAFRLASQLATHERVHEATQTKEHSVWKVDMEHVTCADQNKTQNGHTMFFPSAGAGVSDDKTDVISGTQTETDDSLDRPFKCDLCDKSYIHHRSLTNHKKTHQTGMFKCTVCFKLFNNMAALYSHQRTHKSKSQIDSFCGSYTGASLEQFSPQSQDAPGNFCHLCQVLFPNNEDFEEHIQIHNSSSLSFEAQDGLSQNDSALYDNNMVCPESTFYTSPVNNVTSASSIDNVAVDLSEQITSNGHFYTDCSNHETSSNSTQGQPPIIDPNILAQTQNANNIDKTPRGDFEERPFKCNICFKSYRHSGSLINHKRSHQVGIYQCFICGKNYPHLAALKSHLRIHKAQPTSFNLKREWDWLSFKPLTLENQQGCFSHEKDIIHPALGTEQENGVGLTNRVLFNEHFNQELPSDVTVQLPHNDNLMQRHMCADCGQTFADIAGIKSHSCPLLQQQQNTTRNHYNSSNLHLQDSATVEDPGSNLDFSGLKTEYNQSCFEKKFPEDVNNDSGRAGEEEENNDGDFFQCSICGNSYSSMRALRSHLRGHTQSHSTFSCSDPSSMSSRDEVKEEAGEMMICSTCGKSFANKQDLDNHQLLHSKDQLDKSQQTNECEVKNENVICGSCGIFCTSYHHLESHGCMPDTNHEPATTEVEMKGQNNTTTGLVKEVIEDRQYQCECGRSYRHAASLLNHKKSHKTGVFRCHVCQKRFYNLLALKNHQRSHFDIKRYTCHECGKAFKIQRQLLNHLRRHKENQAKIQKLNNQIQALQKNESRSDEGMQSLSANASQAFNQIQDKMQEAVKELKPEAAIKSEDHNDKRPFACDQCGRTYRHAGSLVNHKNSHKTGQYYCSICNNTYSNQLAMKNHLRTHFAFKRHSCQKCGKRFRAKRQLLVHVCANLRNEGSNSRRGFKSRLFKCEECKQAFPSLKQLTAHKCDGTSVCSDQTNVSTVKVERPFTCNICNRSYRHAGSLLNHKNTHKTGHYICTFCSKHFTNPMALRNHTRIHTQRKKYVCLTCGKAFRLASILYNHQKVHNLVASHFICPACGKSFQGRSGLKRHRCCRGQGSASGVPHSDRGDKCFMCDLCGRSYRHAGSLLNHKKTHSENLHHCTLCLQTFPDLLSLQVHSQMKRQCCPECGKTFCLASHLQSHMEVHSKGQSVVCSVCQQSFSNTASLQQHQNIHHSAQGLYESGVDAAEDNGMTIGAALKQEPPPLSHIAEKANDTANAEEKGHVCEHCGRTYRHAGSLLNHKNSHKTGSFFCSVCQKEFTNLMALKNHRRIHTEPKRYQCVECGKAFRVSAQLICHRRIHTKEKPFTCLLCDKSFSSKSNLRHHQKMHQSNTNEPPFNMDTNAFMDMDLSAFL